MIIISSINLIGDIPVPRKKQIISVVFSVLILLNVLIIFSPPYFLPFANAESGGPTLGEGTYENLFGNWTIGNFDTLYYGNRTINLTGNLTVLGSLTLQNVTLRLNSSYGGQYGICVESGGSLVIRDNDGDWNTTEEGCEITAKNMNAPFAFQVKAGATFRMENSAIHHCGYAFGRNGEFGGLWVNANGSIIKGNNITDSMNGVLLHSVNNCSVEWNNISECKGETGADGGPFNFGDLGEPGTGISLFEAEACEVRYNQIANVQGGEGGKGKWGGWGGIGAGIYVVNSIKNDILSNSISSILGGEGGWSTNDNQRGASGDGYGIYLDNSNNSRIDNNKCNNNDHRGISIINCFDNELSNNTCISNGYGGGYLSAGIYFGSGNNHSIKNNICNFNSFNGIYILSQNTSLFNNSCNTNDGNGIYFRGVSNTLSNNTCSNNQYNYYFQNPPIPKYILNMTNNYADEEPIIYLRNASQRVLWEPASMIILIGCDNITVENIFFHNNSHGAFIYQSEENTIRNNTCIDSVHGITISSSQKNRIFNNNQ